MRYHDIDPERVVVTGWPQTDVFHRPRPRADYEALLRALRARSRPSARARHGQHADERAVRGPLRGAAARLVGARARATASSCSSVRIRATGSGEERFGRARGRAGVHLQEPSFTDLEELTVLLQHADAVVANAGTILLDALVNDRPAVCVLYDEGAPPGESWAAKNVVGKHYEELAASGAFYRAESFDEVVAGIDRALAEPDELAEARRRVVREVVGEVDGRAAERAVDAIVEVVGSTV